MNNQIHYENYQAKLMTALSMHLKADIGSIVPVWFAKEMQHAKGLFVVNGYNSYFEVTYNGDRIEFYIDVYEKVAHVVKGK